MGVDSASRELSGAGPTGLVVDWGGVLTTRLGESMRTWCASEDVAFDDYVAAVKDWMGAAYEATAAPNPVHALERGELPVTEFEQQLAARLRRRDGAAVSADQLIARMFACIDTDLVMTEVVRRARQAGLRTALLSNSWGNMYPYETFGDLFDTVVISAEVGLRKPEPAIFALTAARLGLPVGACVFVDDIEVNVRAATAAGMTGVHHREHGSTLDELEAQFGVRLR